MIRNGEEINLGMIIWEIAAKPTFISVQYNYMQIIYLSHAPKRTTRINKTLDINRRTSTTRRPESWTRQETSTCGVRPRRTNCSTGIQNIPNGCRLYRKSYVYRSSRHGQMSTSGPRMGQRW